MLFQSYIHHRKRSSSSSRSRSKSTSRISSPKKPQPEYNYQKLGKKLYNANEVKNFHNIFKKYDVFENGAWSVVQFEKMMIEGGFKLNQNTIHHLFKQIKNIKKTKISFEDLMEAITVNEQVESEKDYQKVFAVYDRKKRGRFDFNDYESVWAGNKQKFPIQTLQEAFMLMDTNSDGFVNYQEFIKAMRRE